MRSKLQQTPMEKLTANYEQLIKGKETNSKGKELFDTVIKKAAKPKPRSAK